jgi:hypothetical protein
LLSAVTTSGGFPAHITGSNTLDRGFTELLEGRAEFGLPAALIVVGAAAGRVFVGGTPAEAHDAFGVYRSWLPRVRNVPRHVN